MLGLGLPPPAKGLLTLTLLELSAREEPVRSVRPLLVDLLSGLRLDRSVRPLPGLLGPAGV